MNTLLKYFVIIQQCTGPLRHGRMLMLWRVKWEQWHEQHILNATNAWWFFVYAAEFENAISILRSVVDAAVLLFFVCGMGWEFKLIWFLHENPLFHIEIFYKKLHAMGGFWIIIAYVIIQSSWTWMMHNVC